MTIARKSKRLETIPEGQKLYSAQRGESQNWNKLPFPCGSPQTCELCMNSLERENCLRPLPILQITWLTQSNSRSSSSLILSPRQWRTITNIVNYSASMAFGAGVTPSTFIPGFSLNIARRSLPQTHPTHKNFLHALTANRKPPTQLLFAASLIPQQDVIGQTVIFSRFAWYQTVTRDTHSMSITRILLHDGHPTHRQSLPP